MTLEDVQIGNREALERVLTDHEQTVRQIVPPLDARAHAGDGETAVRELTYEAVDDGSDRNVSKLPVLRSVHAEERADKRAVSREPADGGGVGTPVVVAGGEPDGLVRPAHGADSGPADDLGF